MTGTVPVKNFLLTGTVPVNNSSLTGTLHLYLLFYSYIEFGLFAKNKWPLVTSVFEFEPSKSYILTPLTSSQLPLNCRDKTCSDQEAVFNAHITIWRSGFYFEILLFLSPQTILIPVKYGCIEHLSYSYQDLGVQCPISFKLDLYFVSYITKYGESYYSCSCCVSNNIELTSSPKTWI